MPDWSGPWSEALEPMARTRATEPESAVVGASDAKTRLSRLLDRVERGEVITITRNGVPVARLVPMARAGASRSREKIRARFLTFQEAHPLQGLTTRDLVNEGRRP